ncbi:hypothetical protein H7X46_07605 [Pseudonocardia sp. C8]|uniref:hypothetical protein n=1 Tax=Pseudonocardia sp. C8 TaxID=2762759 RepID=UPI0016432BC7|nr:hypothetical protein [Pseudonocardia sp. C8]MBC3190926.1 hypothetical protein [Pseudonocardia sp. C8]
MSGQSPREWAVPERVVRPEEIDSRLLGPIGRTGLLQIMVDHDPPTVGRCPGCGWAVVRRRECPSRVIARALLENTPLPARLAHLAAVVPGARVGRDQAMDREARREAEDALPGLFAAPARRPEPRRTQ